MRVFLYVRVCVCLSLCKRHKKEFEYEKNQYGPHTDTDMGCTYTISEKYVSGTVEVPGTRKSILMF